MNRLIVSTAAFVILASAPLWAQKGGGGFGGGGVKGGNGNPGGPNVPGGLPGLPNDKLYSKEGCVWVEPCARAKEAARADDRMFLVYVYEEKGNGTVLANDFYLLDVIQLSKTTWVFTKLIYSKENADVRRLAVKKPGTVLGLDRHGNEWRRLENLSTIELKGLLASVPDQIRKFLDKVQSDFARAEALAKTDLDKAGRLFAEIARLPRKGYKEIEEAVARVQEISERQFKSADLAFSADDAGQGAAILRQMAADYKGLPQGMEAELRLAEIDVRKGVLATAIQRAKAALRLEGQEGFAPAVDHAERLLEKIAALGEDRIAAARKLGASGDRPKAAALLRQIALDFAGTEAARKAAEAARSFE